jgi:5-methylcytosine-specific restriction protein A
MVEQRSQIKKTLEQMFDIPFSVDSGVQEGEPWFEISPDNDNQELFKLNVKYSNETRVIITFIPEKYSASLIKDMSDASAEKKSLFSEYASLLINIRFAHIDLLINGNMCDPCNHATWPDDWRDFSCRITRSPISGENEVFKPVDLTIDWCGIVMGMFLSLMNVTSVCIDESEHMTGHLEGKSYLVKSTRYERNPLNRELCIALKGCYCSICGFDFQAYYGVIGRGFIEVHHIEPISAMGEERKINPKEDLLPVCSNCHSILHRRNPPYYPDDIIKLISN